MNEINTLKDELKMRVKLIEDNKVEISQLKEKVYNQTNLKDSYDKLEMDSKTLQHSKEKILYELKDIQRENELTKRAIDD
jgi:hypothetical protein